MDERKHNQKLYDYKRNGVCSLLRAHFKELTLTEEQHEWFQGKLELTTGRHTAILDIYCPEKRARRWQEMQRRLKDSLQYTQMKWPDQWQGDHAPTITIRIDRKKD